jgi:glycosyltransferase involved in cell wall biosynthesis
MGPGVLIGVHAHAEPARLVETVRSLQVGGVPGADIVLLADGPDAALLAALGAEPELSVLPQSGTSEPRGAAACLNRLVTASGAAVLVLIESGTVLGPGCLQLLVDALRQPGRGLAGPSTNRSWNEQAVFRGAGPAEVKRTAAMARQRFGSATRSLEPLHSLAEFCLAISRKVVDQIGAADEGYGVGPCWEMDYNIRAARAGFKGVWVGAAYAYRHPPTVRRRVADIGQMQSAKHRYQDHFCGLRLRQERADYADHCLGEACTHFAPANLITTVRRLPAPASAGRPAGLVRPPAPPATPAATAPIVRPAVPLVTAIMPTKQQPEFALQAVRYFLAQDYPNKELLVLEDGIASLAGFLPEDPRIRYVATGSAQRSIGAMRNQACQLAGGDIVVHWDDHDWHGTQRISRQVAAIAAGDADITALRGSLMFDLPAWRFWRCRPEPHRQLFVRDAHDGTLVYRRRVWQEKAQFPDRSPAEYAIFLDQAVRRGARLAALDADGIYIHVKHDGNAERIACGVTEGAAAWESAAEPDFPADVRAFYAARSAGAVARLPTGTTFPLVSCVMPTFDRRAFVPQSVRYFLRQDYPAKELIIIDDGPEPVSDLLPCDDRLLYRRLETRTILGTKRNMACELARGSIIVHWDDDDWSAPNRLSVQAIALSDGDADICGVASLLYYDVGSAAAWRFTWPPGYRPWAAGPTLCFRKELWTRSPFPDVAIGEDTRFVFSPAVHRVADVQDTACVVGIIHRGNTAPKSVRGAHWSPRPVSEVEHVIGGDMAFYRGFAAAPNMAMSVIPAPG